MSVAHYKRRFLAGTFLAALLLVAGDYAAHAQTLVLNGARMTIANGAYLVVNNSASTAIKRNSGYIVSEGEDNVIRWNIGTAIGTYVIPWGYGSNEYLPVTFTKAAGTGANGYFLFSTYHTGWDNSSMLPSDVADFSSPSGNDKSALAVDRFWQVNALGYTAKPALTNLILSYSNTEFLTPNTTSVAGSLSLQRWNSTTGTWNDFGPGSNSNTGQRTVTLASVTAANNYAWWAADYVADRHWVSTGNNTWNSTANWSTTAGGASGASVPGTIDEVFFDDAFDAGVTLNANVSVGAITMGSGYTGAFTQGTRTVTVANGMQLDGGTFAGGTAAVTVGGTLEIGGTGFTSTSGTLDLKGDFAMTGGSFNANNGTMRFSGTATQSISSNAAVNFNNISVTNTASPGVALQTNENLTGVLTLANNVHFDADGTKNGAVFTLLSTADSPVKDAAIASLPTGAVVEGNVTVQRYMSIEGASGGRIYRYIASPVQNGTVADFQKEIPVTGTFTGVSSCSGCTKSSQTMFEYRESVVTDLNKDGYLTLADGYIDFPDASNTETFVPGKGYAVYVRGNILTTARWDLRGLVTAGNVTPVTLPVTYTSSGNSSADGWNLVGNPFPSTIDWSAASGWTRTNVNNAVYVHDNGAAIPGFATWNGVTGTNGGSRYIAMGQAFWVKASGAGTPVLRANENVKAPAATATFFREAALTDLLRVTLVSGTQRDEIVVHFREDATNGFDTNADALKMYNDGFNLSSTLSDGTTLAINSLASMDCNASVALNLENVAAGTYSLNFSELESFPASTAIMLTDTWSGKTIDVRNQASYSFQITKDVASYGSKRFQVTFTGTPASSDFRVAASQAIICDGSDVTLTVTSTQADASYIAMIGTDSVSTSITASGDSLTLTIPAARLQSLENPISVSAQMPGCKTIARQAVTVNVIPQLNVRSVVEAKNCGPGEVALQALSADEHATFNWYASETDTTALNGQHTATFITPELSQSKTFFVSALYDGQCESVRVPVKATVVTLPDAAITQKGDSLVSGVERGNQWYFNDELIAGATSQVLMPEQAGEYKVVVQYQGCSTSASRTFVITDAEQQPEAHFSLFPNPVVSNVTIDFGAPVTSARTIYVINELGIVLSTAQLAAGSSGALLNLTNLPGGVYILKITGGDNAIERKIVKK